MTLLVPESTRAGFHRLRVRAVDRLCDDATAITFDVPPGLRRVYAFRAGQSLTLRRVVDGVEHRRSYSICAPVGRPPRIGVREIPDGLFSTWLVRQVRPGDEIEVSAPAGAWRADPRGGERHLCIAAGSGITPVLSVASTVLENEKSQVSVLYGNRSSHSVMFAEELGDLKNRYGPRFQLVHVLSREPREVELFSGRLDAGRVRRLLTALVPVETFDQVWLCGPLRLVEDARAVLAELGVPDGRIHAELFHVDAPPPPPLRRSGAAGVLDATTEPTTELTTVLDGLATTATVSRETTILDGAQTGRAGMPFACRGGVCGTCRARVRGGEVDMRRNYALEPAEVAAGFVLTCQTYPLSGSVTVDYDA
ncbi:phenylacetate-CoA oxygenase/reductase subunit PaaK [Kineosporia sp. J2-2]|uniref:Phenylacetate-CoA oxygenase/reductase subunit PaaK n=1 Tax=Kineosporia corallincola TaxID=2835133 RepID=A0ABS5THM3_9ACTN|nr:1,2-phenylacetyl-CoA epoxidase subunit PaaE [Kineosporia corallincola]MBT0770595.1 phenylacetate-CoA oxygenase/reductase subunit PaaK [Kineosporia corallincola]